MGAIDLDPASSKAANEIVRATRYYTITDNGLLQPWFGRIWLNPPYGRHAPKFVKRFATFYRSGDVEMACLLLAVHHMTTRWFGALADFSPIACLPPERLHFSGSTVRPAHGSVILGFGVDRSRFTAEFGPFGRVWVLG